MDSENEYLQNIRQAINDEKPRFLLEKHQVSDNLPNQATILDVPFSIKTFKKGFSIVVVRYTETQMEFDLIGIHSGLVNSFRRIIMSEVPTMAIDKVHMYNNTSIIQDECLSHRLGLIPLKADPRLFEFKTLSEAEGTSKDTLEFELKVKCTWNKDDKKDTIKTNDKYKNSNVLSKEIKWIPMGNQEDLFQAANVGPIDDDILLAKMRPGQEIHLKMLAVKGVGRDHAKFSPVCSNYYRLLPEIKLLREVKDKEAVTLENSFSKGTIKLEQKDGHSYANVGDARYESCSRNVFRHDELKDAVAVTKVRDYFIYNIESCSSLPPDSIFIQSINLLKSKCLSLLAQFDNK